LLYAPGTTLLGAASEYAMDPFHYAKNFYSNAELPQQLTWELALLLLSLVAVMAGVVLIRRAFGQPHRSRKGAVLPPGLTTVERHEIGGRFWHWSLFGMILALWISGAAFFAPGSVRPAPLGIPWLYVHLGFGALFIAGTLAHSVHGFMSHLDPRTVWFDRYDWKELAASARYYLGLAHEVPKLGKWGVWSKVFHAALTVLAIFVIVSGISLSLDTLGWAVIDQNWQRQQRLLHDAGAYGFLVLFAAHIFWQLLKSRRAQLKSIFTGTIPAETFRDEYDWDRWKAHGVQHDAPVERVGHGQ
jgi:cytochrome b subunit of formate dehydrogenase